MGLLRYSFGQKKRSQIIKRYFGQNRSISKHLNLANIFLVITKIKVLIENYIKLRDNYE